MKELAKCTLINLESALEKTAKRIKKEQSRIKYLETHICLGTVSKICKNIWDSTIRKQIAQLKIGQNTQTDACSRKVCR